MSETTGIDWREVAGESEDDVMQNAYHYMFPSDLYAICEWAAQIALSRHASGVNMALLGRLLAYSDRYEISIQFWPEQTAVYVSKNGVELTDFGGDADFAIGSALAYLDRINQHGQNDG